MAEINAPSSKRYPLAYLNFDIDPDINYGPLITRMTMECEINAGYKVTVEINDAQNTLLTRMLESGYFRYCRTRPVQITFQYLSGPKDSSEPPKYATKEQIALIIGTEHKTTSTDGTLVKFIAIDPPSFYLNMGDASGGSYRGRVDQVITQVVNKYAPEISFNMPETRDSALSRYWMMRMDPKSFISSILEWSSGLNITKTNWLVQVDGNKMEINDQGSVVSRMRGYYGRKTGAIIDSVRESDININNALNLVMTKLKSNGMSASTGDYIDSVTDQYGSYNTISDSTTDGKQRPYIDFGHSFNKPNDHPATSFPFIGSTHIFPIPEITTEPIGLDYKEYLDGRSRNLYLNMLQNIIKAKFLVAGHGEYMDSFGLGADSIYVDWRTDDTENDFWQSGYWTIYGFRHIFARGFWNTELKCFRMDMDSVANVNSPDILI